MLNQKNKYVPDVLDCIANLSNDEVFTSPKLANTILDTVPQELFSNPEAKFLDPCCKSGVFHPFIGVWRRDKKMNGKW